MKIRPIVVCLSFFLLLIGSSCKKGNDNTGNWVGVYNAFNQHDSLNNIVIRAAGDNLLKVEVKGVSGGYIYTYTKFQQVAVNSPTQCTINESTNISGSNGMYSVQGTITLSGTDITLTATGSYAGNVQNINFTGHKQ